MIRTTHIKNKNKYYATYTHKLQLHTNLNTTSNTYLIQAEFLTDMQVCYKLLWHFLSVSTTNYSHSLLMLTGQSFVCFCPVFLIRGFRLYHFLHYRCFLYLQINLELVQATRKKLSLISSKIINNHNNFISYLSVHFVNNVTVSLERKLSGPKVFAGLHEHEKIIQQKS